jgi:hypothetical protein
MIFEVGDIIKNRKYGWWAFVETIEPLYTRSNKEEPFDHRLNCYRFDCGGYKFDFIYSDQKRDFIKVN